MFDYDKGCFQDGDMKIDIEKDLGWSTSFPYIKMSTLWKFFTEYLLNHCSYWYICLRGGEKILLNSNNYM